MSRSHPSLVWATALSFALSGALTACSTSSRRPAHSSDSRVESGSAMSEALREAGVHILSSNLHAHHFMSYKPSRKSGRTQELLGPGACDVQGSFPQDDAKPCRNNAAGENEFAIPPSGTADRLAYFKMACDYAKHEGKLDALIITPHSKNGGGESDTDTTAEAYAQRQALLKGINASYGGTFICALGQEASSISSGNHINILGGFPESAGEPSAPAFFPSGTFDKLYPEVAKRRTNGETTLLQLNHPGYRRDLLLENLSRLAREKRLGKEAMNDFGIDDFAPIGCWVRRVLNKPMPDGCVGVPALTRPIGIEDFRRTFANIRRASGDAIRLIEMVPPGDAAQNSSVTFRPVGKRLKEDSERNSASAEAEGFGGDGFDNYLFYLAAGLRVGPTANQDNHYQNYGTATASRTGVLVASLSEAGMVQALEQRRTYASEDVNARLVMFAADPLAKSPAHLMGEDFTTASDRLNVSVGYEDEDAEDQSARVRFHFYRSDEAFDLASDDIAARSRIVRFESGQARLPSGPSDPAASDTDAEDGAPLAIHSGEVRRFEIPVVAGTQYLFVEVIQADGDHLWSAPIWVNRAR